MKKRKKAALYNPYLDTLGGGEKLILSILKVLSLHDYDIDIFWDVDVSEQVKEKFNLSFSPPLTFRPNIFPTASPLKKITELAKYDAFFYVTNGSYFFSGAKKNYIYCMVPQHSLYNMSHVNRLKTLNAEFITISEFTKKWLSRWGVKAEIIYPYLPDELIDMHAKSLKKEKIILSVGRFFGHLHSKKHNAIITAFKHQKKVNKNFEGYKLVLVGGLKPEDNDYFEEIKSLIGNDKSIILEPNISYAKLISLYKKALYYWHFAGYEIDENQYPERVEHLGITPLEAMAAGCITCCYDAGGPRYMITNNVNGYLFKDEEELFKQMEASNKDESLRKSIQNHAHDYIKNNFSFDVFRNRVEEVILM